MTVTEAVTGVLDNANDECAGRCAACPHPTDHHDTIAARYCAASLAGRFTRGCVCAPSHADLQVMAKNRL